jgi:hypothetical protein
LALTPVHFGLGLRRSHQRANRLEPPVEARLQRALDDFRFDLSVFARRPPTRVQYEYWLKTTTKRLANLSPELASRWEPAGLGTLAPDETVSSHELRARNELLIQLRRQAPQPTDAQIQAADPARARALQT